MGERPTGQPKFLDYILPRTLDRGGKVMLALLDGAFVIGLGVGLVPDLVMNSQLSDLALKGAALTLIVSTMIRYQALSNMRGNTNGR